MKIGVELTRKKVEYVQQIELQAKYLCIYNLHCRTQQMYLMNNRRINSIMMPLHTSISNTMHKGTIF